MYTYIEADRGNIFFVHFFFFKSLDKEVEFQDASSKIFDIHYSVEGRDITIICYRFASGFQKKEKGKKK